MKNKKTITIGSNILSKICNHCETEKLITEFNKAKNGLYGVGATCKLCRRKQMREYRKNNYEKLTNIYKITLTYLKRKN